MRKGLRRTEANRRREDGKKEERKDRAVEAAADKTHHENSERVGESRQYGDHADPGGAPNQDFAQRRIEQHRPIDRVEDAWVSRRLDRLDQPSPGADGEPAQPLNKPLNSATIHLVTAFLIAAPKKAPQTLCYEKRRVSDQRRRAVLLALPIAQKAHGSVRRPDCPPVFYGYGTLTIDSTESVPPFWKSSITSPVCLHDASENMEQKGFEP